MREADFIKEISRIHGSTPFQADAEILPWGDGFLLSSMDSFSEQEDFLAGMMPGTIGHNLACAACSDILACGAKPEYLLQNWCYDQEHDQDFFLEVASGIEEVLKAYGARCVGGDIGAASEWSWTATVIAASQTSVRRVASSRVDFDLYATGCMGAANAALFLGLPQPSFRILRPVPQGALFATDTSGGFMDTLENFRRVNQGMYLEVDANAVISPSMTKLLPPDVEPGWTLVGGVGEYEIVFAMPEGSVCPGTMKIGHGHFCDERENEFALTYNGRHGKMTSAPPDYRALAKDEWLDATSRYWSSLFS